MGACFTGQEVGNGLGRTPGQNGKANEKGRSDHEFVPARVRAAEAPLCYGSYAEHGKGIDFYNTPEAVIEGARVGLLIVLASERRAALNRRRRRCKDASGERTRVRFEAFSQ